ncbi:MAG: hypothetical protein Q9183_001187 [Haloplaca sp. 2 TL-2023]
MSDLVGRSSPNGHASPMPTSEPTADPPLSKNKLKKLRRDQAWEEGRERRKELRKKKKAEKRERKRADADKKDSPPPLSTPAERKANDDADAAAAKNPKRQKSIQLPISFVIDCGFDDLMMDGERKSLASQITRSYSDNSKARFRSHLFVSSFNGHLKNRFETVLSGQHAGWKGVRFLQGDFEESVTQARQLMTTEQGGRLAGAFEGKSSTSGEEAGEKSVELGEVVYLTSDSPDTLTELKPYGVYIIGGIVDKNRHKGMCYKRAMDRGIRTAKLPIGDYMKMSSRFVLATNHVVEIMSRWLELKDWGRAFMQVMPKRKGGILKDGVTVLEGLPTVSGRHGEIDNEPHGEIREDEQEPVVLEEACDELTTIEQSASTDPIKEAG